MFQKVTENTKFLRNLQKIVNFYKFKETLSFFCGGGGAGFIGIIAFLFCYKTAFFEFSTICQQHALCRVLRARLRKSFKESETMV